MCAPARADTQERPYMFAARYHPIRCPLAERAEIQTGRESFAGVATGFLKTFAAPGLTQLLFTPPKLSRSRSEHQTQQVQ